MRPTFRTSKKAYWWLTRHYFRRCFTHLQRMTLLQVRNVGGIFRGVTSIDPITHLVRTIDITKVKLCCVDTQAVCVIWMSVTVILVMHHPRVVVTRNHRATKHPVCVAGDFPHVDNIYNSPISRIKYLTILLKRHRVPCWRAKSSLSLHATGCRCRQFCLSRLARRHIFTTPRCRNNIVTLFFVLCFIF